MSEGSTGWTGHLPPGTAAADVDLLADGSLAAAFTRRWAEAGDRPLVAGVDGQWVGGEELEARSRRIAGRLAGAGLVAGDRVAFSCRSSVDLVVAFAAAVRAGLVVVPVNGAYRQREIAHIVGDAGPSAVVVDDDERGTWFTEAAAGAGRSIVVVGPDVDLPDHAAPADLDAVGPADPALIGYTSGTTGVPKGALLSHGNLVSSVAALRLAWRWTPEDRLVLALPLFHLHGLGVGLAGSLAAGASVVVQPSFDVDGVLDAVAEHQASLFFGVPTMYSRLGASPRVGELAGLRLCVSGSAPLDPALWQSIADGSGQRILERYGMTETVMNVSNPYDGERRPGTVGWPLPGVEVRIDAGADGLEGTDGVEGDAAAGGPLLVRGPNVFAGYWGRPEATAAAFDDGWFRTGDVASVDADGYLSLVGRSSELIIRGGFNIYPREVEEALCRHPSVSEAAVVGVPDVEWGEVVVAFVVGDAVDEDVLRAFAGEQVARFKVPSRVIAVDELPRNALGKVVKADLQSQLTGRRP